MPNKRAIPDRLLVAIGGNAIHPEGTEGTAEEQADMAAATARALVPLMELDGQLIVTHGNGPVVGKILLRQAIARGRVTPMPLDICVAHSQGGIAYLLMQALENALREKGNSRHVVCLLTQVEVDPDDPAFGNPTKPIGYFYDAGEAQSVASKLGWEMKEDAGRGWRHVVASPKPRHIVDISLIRALADHGAVVIAGGGGGIPVRRQPNGVRHGVEAVIDKDLTSAHMARILGIEEIMILTAVPRVARPLQHPGSEGTRPGVLIRDPRLPRGGPFPAGQHGAQDRGGDRLSGSRRPARRPSATWTRPYRRSWAKPEPTSSPTTTDPGN